MSIISKIDILLSARKDQAIEKMEWKLYIYETVSEILPEQHLVQLHRKT